MNFIIELIVCIIGCTSIGAWWFGPIGGIFGFILGCYLFYKLRKRKSIDYNRIEKMLDQRLGKR